jgi:hypothetical protein
MMEAGQGEYRAASRTETDGSSHTSGRGFKQCSRHISRYLYQDPPSPSLTASVFVAAVSEAPGSVAGATKFSEK